MLSVRHAYGKIKVLNEKVYKKKLCLFKFYLLKTSWIGYICNEKKKEKKDRCVDMRSKVNIRLEVLTQKESQTFMILTLAFCGVRKI